MKSPKRWQGIKDWSEKGDSIVPVPFFLFYSLTGNQSKGILQNNKRYTLGGDEIV